MIDIVLDVSSWCLLLGGGFFLIVSGVGLLRFPEVYTRMHAAGIADTLGAGLTLVGLMLQVGFGEVTIKLALILVFLAITTPTATHALANALYFHSPVKPKLDRPDATEDRPS